MFPSFPYLTYISLFCFLIEIYSKFMDESLVREYVDCAPNSLCLSIK
jgi:hypothetical protein